jgi:hypothetical protein
MNIFNPLLRLTLVLLAPGISLKTQELYVIVFLTRYLDLFIKYYSVYNTAMKLVFLGTSIGIVWYMRYHKVVKQTYSKEEDTFRHYFLILLSVLLALLIHRAFNVIEVRNTLVFVFFLVCFSLTIFFDRETYPKRIILNYYSIQMLQIIVQDLIYPWTKVKHGALTKIWVWPFVFWEIWHFSFIVLLVATKKLHDDNFSWSNIVFALQF